MKIIMHWYLVPIRLVKMFLDTSLLCFRGCGNSCTLFHTWWTCPHIQSFWNKVFQMIRKVIGYPIPQTPQFVLLNRWAEKTPRHVQTLLFYILLRAKITLTCTCKQPRVSFLAAKRKISWIMMQEKLVSIFQDRVRRFKLVWEPWANFINIPL